MHQPSQFFNKDRNTEFDDQHVQKFAVRNSATYNSLFRARLFGSLLLFALGCLELSLALSFRVHEACADKLPEWMLMDGSTTVLAAGLALLSIRRKGVMRNVDLQAYLLRKDRGADEDPAWEGELAALEGSVLDRIAHIGSAILVMLFGFGCYMYYMTSGFQGCGHAQGQWMVAVLAAKLLLPLFSCCLASSCFLGTYFAKDPKESYWDDQPTDFW